MGDFFQYMVYDVAALTAHINQDLDVVVNAFYSLVLVIEVPIDCDK